MLNIYTENNQIVLEDGQERIEIPYSEDAWNQLQGEITHDEYKGWMVNGKEVNQIIK